MRWGSLLVLAVVLTACAGERSSRPARPQGGATPSERASARAEATVEPGDERLEVRAGGVRLVATLRDTAAARDLVTRLPAVVRMRDHGGVEKTGPLQGALAVDEEPAGADPEVGDLGYYAPGNDLVLYYGDQDYFDGIVVLGRLEGDLAALGNLAGDTDVQVTELTDDD